MSISKAITSISSLVSEFIEDPDKQAELTLKLSQSLLETQTTPKTDAFVKILIAFRDIAIPMFRPLGSIGMSIFGGYCVTKGIQLPEYIMVALFGAPLAWGASRHKEKVEKVKRGTWDD